MSDLNRLYRIIPEPQDAAEMPGNARLEWVVPVSGDVWIGKDGGEYTVHDGGGQPVDVVVKLVEVEEPDYDAAMTVLTMELVAWRARIAHLEPAHVLLENPSGMPLYATRQKIARKVVDAANREEKP